jgi:hypothetical protein
MKYGYYSWQSYLYVTTNDKLVVLDMSDPDSPVQKSTVDTPAIMYHLAVDQQLAYMCGNQDNLSVATVYPSETPGLLGVTFPENANFTNKGLFVNGGYLVDLKNGIGFQTFDLYQ